MKMMRFSSLIRIFFGTCSMYFVYKGFVDHEHPRTIRFIEQKDHSWITSSHDAMVNDTKQHLNKSVLFAGPNVKVRAVNCSRIFAGDHEEFIKADAYHKLHKKLILPDADYIGVDSNCTKFRSNQGYIMSHVTEEERSFPIAFSILMFKHVEQTERLLRAIYRPHNFYCIHVDRKSAETVYQAIVSIAACFDNVFVASKRINVVWGNYTVLEPDLLCMEELLRYKTWRYFINLTGMEFPLKTNGDLVKILKAYNGANDVMGITRKRQNHWVKERTKKKLAKQPTPYNITIVKGGVQVTLSRAFVEFVFSNPAAIEFLEWIKETEHPDESYIHSLNYNPQLAAPGAYLGDPDLLNPPFLNRHVVWTYHPGARCYGQSRRSVCVFGVRDLPSFLARKELFVNKMLLNMQPLTYDCAEEWHFRKIREEYAGDRHFDSSYYANTAFAKNHRLQKL